MPTSAHPYPGRCLLRAVWSIDPLPADYLNWRQENIRQAIAYHEAGHALLMHGFGVAGIEARLSPDGCDGEVFHSAPIHAHALRMPLPIERTNAILAAAVFHAGLEAEQLAGGFNPPTGTEWRCATTTDHEKADATFGDLFFRGKPHGYTKAVARAALSRNREALDRIAQYLMRAGEWKPSDTPAMIVHLADANDTAAAACLAYGDPALPSRNLVSPGAGESRPHSLTLAGHPGHAHAGARLDLADDPGGASGVVNHPFVFPTIQRHHLIQFQKDIT